MPKYIIEFSKTGTICYTSHLDLIKVFKRTFKRADIKLAYSQGFNPHPKMGFAQPLSLGYSGLKEFMEFETERDYEPEFIEKKLQAIMPEGLDIKKCSRANYLKKTLAAETEAAEYIIAIPLKTSLNMNNEEIKAAYMGQEQIIALKKQKKKKELARVDIKPMIRNISFTLENGKKDGNKKEARALKETGALSVTTVLDSGSVSNLSPELMIDTLKSFLEINTDRSEIEVMRKKIFFNINPVREHGHDIS